MSEEVAVGSGVSRVEDRDLDRDKDLVSRSDDRDGDLVVVDD